MAAVRKSYRVWEDTVNPTINEDSSNGFQVGDYFRNTATGKLFFAATVAVAAAQWIDHTLIEQRFEIANEGRVKIKGSGGVNPTYALSAGVDQVVDYGVAALDLSSSPTNEWPQNIAAPTDSDIWDSANTTLIENTILGQLHEWRIILDYSGKNLNDVVGLEVRLENRLSGFIAADTLILPEGTTSGTDQQALVATIADGASLPAPFGTGQGYELILNSPKALTVEITSVTRFSNFHNTR